MHEFENQDSEVGYEESGYKIRERIDYEEWIFQHLLEMTKVQADGDLETYENMLNTLILTLKPYWPEGFEERWREVRKLYHPDRLNPLNKQRIEEKEILKAELIDMIGIGFTKKKNMKIKGGLVSLWKLFPPFPPNESTQEMQNGSGNNRE